MTILKLEDKMGEDAPKICESTKELLKFSKFSKFSKVHGRRKTSKTSETSKTPLD